MTGLETLHFLRPDWLWALFALPVFGWWWQRRRRRGDAWREVVDPHLLPHLVTAGAGGRPAAAAALGALAFALAVAALAGPSWRQDEQPLWQGRTPLVVAIDLSGASLAGDLPPSRLAQARAKLDTLLRERAGGQVGLVAYADDAFTVAPLTDDAGNVALFLDSLDPGIMPVDGQRADRAIAWSSRLLRQAGFDRGRILLLTNAVDATARDAAATAFADGFRVSVIGLGTSDGSPYRTPNGAIQHSRLEVASLRQLARAGGGEYVALSADAGDLQALGVLDPATGAGEAGAQGATRRTGWRDEGYWLLPPLMLLGLLAFRRGAPVLVLLVALGAGWMAPAGHLHAEGLWRRADQIEYQRMQQAAQAYRAGEFARAAELYRQLDTASAHYNRGNALARDRRYQQALEAYDRALQLEPGMPDAVANREAVEAEMQRQPPPEGGPQPQSPGGGQQAPDPRAGQQARGGEGGRSPQAASPPPPPAAGAAGAEDGDAADTPSPQAPTDAQAQRAADAAQKAEVEAALARGGGDGESGTDDAPPPATSDTAEQRERRITNEAWLRRVPDEPGGLLREKFRLEHERRRYRRVLED